MKGIYREKNKFYQDITVPCYDVDSSRYLKPASFMDMAQELAHWAAELLGAGFDVLARKKTAWVLSRMHIHFGDAPEWRDDIRLWTWHKGFDGLFFLRDFSLRDESGRERVTATSSWLIIDTESRRLLRNPSENALLDLSTAGEGDAIAEPAPKIQLPAGAHPEEAGEHRVSYSDIDFLGHTNNVRYMVWAMDCIDFETVTSRRPKDVYINYNRETHPGETVCFRRFRTESAEGGVSYYIEGLVDGRQSFIVKVDY